MTKTDLLAALGDANVQAFLRVIRDGESSQEADAYTVMFGGEHFDAPPWDHPNEPHTAGGYTSTAAGAYQFLAKTWRGLMVQYGFEDFSPGNQDLGAVALVAGRGALEDVKAGRLEAAIAKCGKEWASLPGSPYGQPTRTLERARAVFADWGGTIADPQPSTDGVQMVPIPLLLAGLDFLKTAFPAVANAFSKPTVPERNVEIANSLLNAATQATNTPNFQAAIEAIQNDPAAKAAAEAAIHQLIPTLMEVGGGITEARKATFEPGQIPFWKNPAFVFWITVAPLVYAGVYAVLFGPSQFSDDAKMMVLTALFSGLLGAGTGFFLGSSLSSQTKDQRTRAS